jgi:hypothetical protein
VASVVKGYISGTEQGKDIVTSDLEDDGLLFIFLEIVPNSYSINKASTYLPGGEAISPSKLFLYTLITSKDFRK